MTRTVFVPLAYHGWSKMIDPGLVCSRTAVTISAAVGVVPESGST
ncbi:hypothetical protein ACFXJ8_15280 [Nonomuraea sp. NPDC059194]